MVCGAIAGEGASALLQVGAGPGLGLPQPGGAVLAGHVPGWNEAEELPHLIELVRSARTA